MKFTALEEYGLRCILHLARSENISLTLGEIAQKEGLTQQYAGKIFRILGRAGLVESARGRKGGYRMARPAEAITLSDVLAALGGRFFDREICDRYTGNLETCVHSGNCVIRPVWLEVQRVVDEVLKRRTLKDLVNGDPDSHQRVQPLAVLGAIDCDTERYS